MTKQEPKENEMTDINPTTPGDDLDPDLARQGKNDPNFGSFGFEDTESSNSDSNVTLTNAQNSNESTVVATSVEHGNSASATRSVGGSNTSPATKMS